MENKNTDIEALKRRLNKCLEVVESTFDKFGIQLIKCSFNSINEKGFLEMKIKMISRSGKALEEDLLLKINFYNEDNAIIYVAEEDIYADEFPDYDSFEIDVNENDIAFNTVKCRAYIVKEM